MCPNRKYGLGHLRPDAVDLGLVFFPAFDWKISPTHPEREERLLYTRDQLLEEGIFDLPGGYGCADSPCACGCP